jgi:hypothetical protein
LMALPQFYCDINHFNLLKSKIKCH